MEEIRKAYNRFIGSLNGKILGSWVDNIKSNLGETMLKDMNLKYACTPVRLDLLFLLFCMGVKLCLSH
jgi:hypothetical protein